MSQIVRELVWKRDRGICAVCGKRCDHAAFHLAHDTAVSLGGNSLPDNLAVSHPRCNLRMGNMSIEQARRFLK